ncbi:MAG: HMA2 domain-containing protein [Candidatus Binatia bacterium]
MHIVSAYLHALDGRLRIKVAEVKGSPVKALEVESRLHRVEGIDQVTANPITGNILIFYDSHRITQSEVIDALRDLGCLRDSGSARIAMRGAMAFSQTVSQELPKALFRSTMEFALQRLVSTLI